MPQSLQAALPSEYKNESTTRKKNKPIVKINRTNILLNKDQITAINFISSNNGTTLLAGITGSGKTQVYIEMAKKAISNNQSVIILVPEISLTSQMLSQFSNYFDNIIVTHSEQTKNMRYKIWLKCLNSKEPVVVIGPRSTLFMPIKNIGLIVIDEFHDQSYKQEQSPRYVAQRVAKILALNNNAKLVLASATPPVCDYYLAEKNQSIVKMPNLAVTGAKKPNIILVDNKNRDNFKKHRFLSDKLLSTISSSLTNHKQVLIFHNRRGSTTTTLCKGCGWIAKCPDTDLPLTLHIDKNLMISHLTGKSWPIPTSCPVCGSTDIINKGIGTKLIEQELKKTFPDATVARFDSDTPDNMKLNNLYQEIYDGKINIIIGTQTITKGLDLPNLETVGIIQADSGLAMPDYTSEENVFQLISQVIGRVGRNCNETTVVVQTYQPNEPAVIDGITQNYDDFYQKNILVRKKKLFPPFVFLLKIVCSYSSEDLVIKHCNLLVNEIKKTIKNIVVLGPAPAFYEHLYNTHRWQIIIKAKDRNLLLKCIKIIPKDQHWHFDIDPSNLL